MKGPRSLTFNLIALPFERFITSIQVISGSVRCAAVRPLLEYVSPLAVGRPSNPGPYQLAVPRIVMTWGREQGLMKLRTRSFCLVVTCWAGANNTKRTAARSRGQ